MSQTLTGSVPASARAVAPDLARGAMLLMIALANIHLYLHGPPGLRGYPADLGIADQVVTVLQMVLVDGRAYPLFALLVGYGAVQSARRRAADDAVRILRRRGLWMIVIGGLHGILLFPADIVGGYGLLLVLSAGILVRGRTGTLVTLAVAGTAVNAAVGVSNGLPTGLAWPSMAAPDLTTALVRHTVEWLGGTIASALVTAGMLALGALAARRGLLDDPGRHRRLLRRTAVAGLVLAVPSGLPLAFATVGWWDPGTGATLLGGVLHQVGGIAGGIGFAAVFGLLATRVAPPALLATGRRSLSAYLGQSVVFCALLPAWTLGLGSVLSVWQVAVLAVATWLLGIGFAVALERAGRRGPAETVLRRMTYGPRRAT
ncbi:DUF418 domain-containing protein [Pseudonocardia sp. HH130630-07]|uniref:DUF418 domain-containing protein n=1 Tax=Pseudonocardia sp. HH130630-07 TaxID=1690815 RepID=UPI000814D5B0|nr:DUF418 domain-containing protein [Pseudonocardia sp. HH130630-07]ANY06510.1 hypothetical protein AFB00_09640 [Pseudonocardia sp. HH130630-07]